MNGNPFYVHPGGDMTQGLAGLGQTFNQIGERKRADAARQEEKDIAEAAAKKFARIKTEAQAAYNSNDPDAIARFNIANPEMGKAMQLSELRKHKDEETLNSSLDSSYAFLAKPTKENAIKLVSARKQLLTSKGIPLEQQTETDSFLERFDADPEKLVNETNGRLAAVDTERYMKYRDAIGNPVTEEKVIRKEERSEEALIRKESREADRLAAKELREANRTLTKEDAKAATELSKEQQKQVNVLRDDIFDITKPFRLVEQAFSRIEKVGGQGTAASDLSLIFNYMKMLDPGSTVREGEFANAQNSAGVPDRVKNVWNRMQEGTRLAPDQRKQFIATAKGLFEAQRSATDTAIDGVLQQADQDAIPRTRVLGETTHNKLKERMANVSAPTEEGQQNIATQAEFDALPSGSVYMEDGKQYRKP